MELLRWILLGLGLLLIAAIWFQGRRQRAAHTESLLARARRGWQRRRTRAEERRSAAAPATDEERREPELGDDVAASELDEFLNDERRSAPGFDRPAASSSETATQAAADDDTAEPAGGDVAAATSAPGDDGDAVAETRAAEAESDEPFAAAAPAEPASDEPEPADTTEPSAGADEEKIIAFYVVAPGGERLSGAELQAAFAEMDLVHGELDIFHRRDDSGRTLFSVANATEPGTFDPATMAGMTTPGVALFARLPGPATPMATFDEIAAATWRLAELLQAQPLDSRQSTLSRQTEQAMRDEILEYQRRRVRRSR